MQGSATTLAGTERRIITVRCPKMHVHTWSVRLTSMRLSATNACTSGECPFKLAKWSGDRPSCRKYEKPSGKERNVPEWQYPVASWLALTTAAYLRCAHRWPQSEAQFLIAATAHRLSCALESMNARKAQSIDVNSWISQQHHNCLILIICARQVQRCQSKLMIVQDVRRCAFCISGLTLSCAFTSAQVGSSP